MKWPKQYGRVACRAVAVLLLLAGLFCGYGWFYKLAPARRTLSPEWRLAHSQREYWGEVQKGIHRGVWLHDDGLAVGMYGDKSWAQWIMAHVAPGEDMGCFGRLCHSATAMRYITNQDVGEEAAPWLKWWAKNKSKSQPEWIADGFRQRGLEIDVPPAPDQTPALLELLGNPETDESAETINHLKYNAFRCLRDTDFDPVGYAISDRPFSTDVERGLLEYARRQRLRAANGGVGVLPLGKTDDECQDYAVAAMPTPKIQFVAYSLVFVPLTLGAALLAWSFRKGTATR